MAGALDAGDGGRLVHAHHVLAHGFEDKVVGADLLFERVEHVERAVELLHDGLDGGLGLEDGVHVGLFELRALLRQVGHELVRVALDPVVRRQQLVQVGLLLRRQL